jgi:hypothetical protein
MSSRFRIVACALFAIGGLQPTAAQEAPTSDQILMQAKKCLRLPGAINYQSYRAVVLVTFENGAVIELRANELDPPGEAGESILAAATRAIERCGPYPTVEDGEYRLSFESEE